MSRESRCSGRYRRLSLEPTGGLGEFREHLGGELTITLLTDLGVGHEVHEIDAHLMMQAATWLRDREAAT